MINPSFANGGQAIASSGKQPSGDETADEQTDDAGLAAKLPLGLPWLDPAAIAPLVVLLTSGAAPMVSGTSLAVTGATAPT